MGREAACTLRLGRKRWTGRALLESAELIFRGERRLVIPFRDIRSMKVVPGVLEVEFSEGNARFEIRPVAEKWEATIRRGPKRLIDKLGIVPDARVSVIGISEPGFLADLASRTRDVSTTARKNSAAILFGVTTKSDLRRLTTLRRALEPSGALWVVWPKGRPEIREDIRSAALAIGLVDVKVAAFSTTLSALKLVIPRALRGDSPRQR